MAPPPVAPGVTPFLPGYGTAWVAGVVPPAPQPPVVPPTTFQAIAPQYIEQHRVNIVQALVGDPVLLAHIRKFGTLSPAQVGVRLTGQPPMAPAFAPPTFSPARGPPPLPEAAGTPGPTDVETSRSGG
eukprot:6135489-Alexandrium_andersonii.AAC.1